ncbi:MAG TPA: hypothetical protein VIW72_04935, partial [Burkholderiales bacterium]
MPSQVAKRPREITAASVVAFIGSGLFILAGLLLAVFIGLMLHTFRQKYPGVSLQSKDPDFIQIERLIASGTVIPLILGAIGISTGVGLLRLRPWARRSAIAWSVGSSLLCLGALAYPSSASGIRFSATSILLLMLIIFPVNVWWLMLFFRPATRLLFARPNAVPTSIQLPEWLEENLMAKLIIAVA